MNLNQLRLFYYAAKLGSPGLAAKELYITPPAVTNGIQRLEDSNEIKLFNRSKKKYVLTNAGKALYPVAETIFEMEIMANDCIRSFQNHTRKYIRIHSHESFGAYFLPSLINLINKSYPKIYISVDIMPTYQVIENTVSLKNDLGFISFPIENDKLSIREILEDSIIIIVRPDHPLAKKAVIKPKDLEGQVLIRQRESSAIPKVFNKFVQEENIHVHSSFELSNNEAIKRAVEMGSGVALISKEVVRKEIKRGELKAIPLSDRSCVQKYYLIHHKSKYISNLFQSLLNIIQKWQSDYAKNISD